MIWFLLSNIVFISVGTILYLILRALPRIEVETPSNEEVQSAFLSLGMIDRFMHSGIPEKLDSFFRGVWAKMLRRIKIITLKTDNLVTQNLKNLQNESVNSRFFKGFKKPKNAIEALVRVDEGEPNISFAESEEK